MRYTALFIGMAAMTLSSCVKNTLFDTPHPDTGGLTVTTEWSGRSNEGSIPESYTLKVGNVKEEVTGETNRFFHLLAPGNHNLTVYNVPEYMSIYGSTISVDRLDGTLIESMPGDLFIANRHFDIAADSELDITVPMQQYTRRLKLTLTVQQGQYDRVANAHGTLSGICGAVDIISEQRSAEPLNTAAEVVQDGNKFLLQYNLLGIVPSEKQILKIDISFTNGDTQTIESDLTDLLRDFHSEVSTLILTGDLSLPLESGFSGLISGWEVANGGNTDAH